MTAQMNSDDNGTQKVDKLAEKYREFIDLFNTENYFQCIELCLELESDLDDNAHQENVQEWKQKSVRAAAESFYTETRYDEMKSVLTHLNFEEQYSFLNAKGNCEEYLLQLFKDHDKKELLVNHFIKKNMFLQAGKTESDLEMKAKYFCIAVRQSYTSKNIEQANIVCEAINELLNEELNPTVRCELFLNKIQIEHDTEFSIIKEIYLHYSKKKNFLMTLLSLLICSQEFPESVLELIYSDQHIALKYLIEFCDSLFKIIIRQSCNITGASEESLLSDFGMQKVVDDSNMIFFEDETKLLFLHAKTSRSYKNPLQNGTQINISLARTQISNILFGLVLELISFCHFQLESKIKESCSAIHVESCAYERCIESHEYPSASSFVAGFHLYLTLLEFHALSRKYQRLLRNDKHDADDIRELQKLSVAEGTIFSLNEYLLYYLSYAHVVVINQYSSCLRDIPESVVNLFTDYIKRTWKHIEDKDEFVNMNFFMYFSFLSNMMNPKEPLTEKLFVASFQDYSIEKTTTNDYLLCFKLLLEGKIDSCVSKYKQCLYKTIQFEEPALLTVCELIELPVIIFFLSLSNLNPSMTLYLPERILAYKELMEGVYDINVNEIIKKVYNHNKSSICCGLQTILNILTGYKDFSFNLIPILRRYISGFQDGSYKTITKLSCERLLIIILVFLCNLPSLSFLRGRERIIKKFKEFPIQENGKLANLFNDISKISTDEHCRKVLACYLNNSKQNLVCYSFSGTRGNYYIDLQRAKTVSSCMDSGEYTNISGYTPTVENIETNAVTTSSIVASHTTVAIKIENDCLSGNNAQRLKPSISSVTSFKNSEGSDNQTMGNVVEADESVLKEKEDNVLRSKSLKRKLPSHSLPYKKRMSDNEKNQ